jgi:hypothetical protein
MADAAGFLVDVGHGTIVPMRIAMPPRAFPSTLVLCSLAAVLLLGGSSCDGAGEGEGEAGEGEGEEGEGEEGEGEEGEGEEGEGEGFTDHTVADLDSVAAFDAVAEAGPSSSAVKFVIPRFGSDADTLRFMDSDFYGLHDEYYWYRLLNGAAIEGLSGPEDRPVTTSHGPFATIDEVYSWARIERAAGRTLPLDLTFVEGDLRLYSPRFYELALFNEPRSLGIGTLLHFPEVTTSEGSRAETWAMELEFSDDPSAADLRRFFAQVEAHVGGGVGAGLKWITRSLAQEQIVATLPEDLRARVISYADVVVPGQEEVYAEGLTAGRLVIVRRGEEALLQTTRSTDVLVVEDVPDFLPACAALLTAQPQTALAHVNLLARNRGIPNAFVAGVDVDPNLDQLSRVRAPVIVQALLGDGAGTVQIKAMSESDFTTWRQLTAAQPTAVPPVDLSGVVDVYDLSALDFADSDDWRPILGGKAAGFLALTSADIVTVDTPLGISIKPYVEHLDVTTALTPRLTAMLADRSFQGDITVRRLVLEGEEAVDAEFVAAFKEGRPEGQVLRDLVDDGGVLGVIRATPMRAETLAAITTELEARFGRYADNQGLRFRSSSNVEDAEGFNGAGLYTSNTGYLRPDVGDVDVEAAIKETWASYWGSEAFEERRLAAVDHLSGAMGVVVHANFADRFERNNGVALFTIPPAGTDLPYVLEVNQQAGALSVTNPPPGSPHLPEIDRVVDDGAGPVIERVRGSSVLLPGADVLDDATLVAMFNDARSIAESWLALENAALPSSQRRSTLTLDFETRFVEPGWPMMRSGAVRPARLVWKQARTLEPSTTRAPSTVQSQPIPRDILARTRRVVRHTCTGTELRFSTTEVFTDPTLSPDMGHSVDPFTSFVIVDFLVDAPAVGGLAGTRRSAVHTAFSAARHPVLTDTTWTLDVSIAAERQAQLQLSRVQVEADGTVVVDHGGQLRAATTCVEELVFAAPADFLAALLGAAP